MGWLVAGLIIWIALAVVGGILIGGEGVMVGLVLGFFAMLLVFYPVGKATTGEKDITCAVESKDRAEKSMRIYTTNCGVLENSDQWFKGKVNSADIWNEIKPGTTQTFHVVGWRFELLSDFPNILEVK